jgi:hypothetical protein
MNQTVVFDMLRILKDEKFLNLHYRVSRGEIRYHDLARIEMPQELSPEQVWELMTALRKYVGSCGSVHETPHETGSWYVENDEIKEVLAGIDLFCQPYSPLSRAVEQRDVTSLFLQALADDILAAMKRDALFIDHETVRALLLKERAPSGYEEHIVANIVSTFDELAAYVDKEFGDELILVLLSRLLSGFEQDRYNRLVKSVMGDAVHREALQIIYDSGNEQYKHPFHDMTTVSFTSWVYRPFDELSGLMELLLRRLALLKRERPVFALVPYSKAHFKVEDAVTKARAKSGIMTSDGVDYTPRMLQLVRLFREELDILEEMVTKIEARDRQLLAIIDSDREINNRQHHIIALALCRPSAEFRIRYHAEQFNIVKASARSDLYGLVKLGFLRKEKRKKEMVFLPALGLSTLIARHRPLYT